MKIRNKVLLTFVLSFLLLGCIGLIENDKKVICIQAFKDFSQKDAAYVYRHLKDSYSHIILSKSIALPSYAYVPSRNRYRADTLINFLKQLNKGDTITVGLTNYDISTTKNGVADWGVMGLGFRPGKACIVSTFRLKNKNKKEQLLKVIWHEIGHTLGLAHCSNLTCLMRDAEGGNPLDDEKEFCTSCKADLTAKGFHFN